MNTQAVIGIQPTVMQWARKSIGLSVSDVAAKLKRSEQEISAWEKGEAAPTYAQLEKLAYQIYKRPLAVFFLPEPPAEKPAEKEFRTLPDTDLQHLLPDTHMQIRRAHAYQLALAELFDGKRPVENRIWDSLTLLIDKPISQQAENIRQLLGISLEAQVAWQNDDIALKAWRQSIEDAGVFVFKSAFKQKEISGFCLVDKDFPLIYLNNSSNTKTRQIFSLLHELSHLLLSINGLSKFDQSYIERLPKDQQKIERFCNTVAAEVLIPSTDFQQQIAGWPEMVDELPDERFSALASRYGVSREAILRRFLDRNRVSPAQYEKKAKFWAAQKRPGSGGDWFASQNTYLSNRFAQEVVSRHYQHKLTIEQASDYLGIKAKNFIGIEERILRGSMA